tara:strand:+ start:1424 stop:1597 length:174 start_codon:yes stop_codon:yes gene_type:complete
MKMTFYSDEIHRGMEMFCDMCNAQYPAWYYRISKDDKYPSYCICEACKEEIEYEVNA